MADYAAINIRIKVKKDIPVIIQSFIDMIFVEADVKKAMTELYDRDLTDETSSIINTTAMKVLYNTNHGELSALDSMLCMTSAYHKSWCWRVKEDHGTHWVYESRASCSHRSTNKDILQLIMMAIAPYLVVSKEDIITRVIYNDHYKEQILVLAGYPLTAIWSEGHCYKTDNGDVIDSDYPSAISRHYTEVLCDEAGADSFTRLVTENAEFVPSWSKTTVDNVNDHNRSIWTKEQNERGWGY